MSKVLHLWLSSPSGVGTKSAPRGQARSGFRLAKMMFWPATGIKALFGRINRRPNHANYIEADTVDLITRYGDQAYYEVEQLSKGHGLVEGGRPRSHWARVKIEIARRHEIDTGLSGSVRWE